MGHRSNNESAPTKRRLRRTIRGHHRRRRHGRPRPGNPNTRTNLPSPNPLARRCKTPTTQSARLPRPCRPRSTHMQMLPRRRQSRTPARKYDREALGAPAQHLRPTHKHPRSPRRKTVKDAPRRVTLAVGSNPKPEPTPTPLERHQHAAAARDRLREAKAEAFKPSQQYRLKQDGTGIVGSGEA